MDALSKRWEDKQYLRYFIKECPFGEDCNAEAWKATNNCESFKCKEHVRDALRSHLQTPGVHHRVVHVNQRSIDKAVANVTIMEQLCPGFMFPHYPPGPIYDIREKVVSPMVCQF